MDKEVGINVRVSVCGEIPRLEEVVNELTLFKRDHIAHACENTGRD